MAKENKRTCICCGTKYDYCPTCGKDLDKPAWMGIYHDENCMNIFHVVNEFAHNEITKELAIEKLKKYDLSKKEDFVNNVKIVLDKIIENGNTIIKETKIDVNENKDNNVRMKYANVKKTDKK